MEKTEAGKKCGRQWVEKRKRKRDKYNRKSGKKSDRINRMIERARNGREKKYIDK